jgi:hypothetical protein
MTVFSIVTKTSVSLLGEKNKGTMIATATAIIKSRNNLQDFSNLESISLNLFQDFVSRNVLQPDLQKKAIEYDDQIEP